MVFQEENRYLCRCSCRTLPSARRNRIQPVDEHTSASGLPPRSVRYRRVASRAAMPAPRACSAADDRSNTVTSHPASRSTSAAVRPPTDPPVTTTRGMAAPCWPTLGRPGTGSGLPERGHLDHLELEQHPALVHRRVAQRVGRLVAGVLHPDPVQLVGDPLALGRVVLGDLPPDHRLEAE